MGGRGERYDVIIARSFQLAASRSLASTSILLRLRSSTGLIKTLKNGHQPI